jgi:hypothetical protein
VAFRQSDAAHHHLYARDNVEHGHQLERIQVAVSAIDSSTGAAALTSCCEDSPFSPPLRLGARTAGVCLVRSVLSPAGAKYEILSRAPLGPR